MSIVTLPRLHWGSAAAPRHALLVHGLGSSGATTWHLAEGLAAAGWSATAVDLRGHGDAPRASRYRIEDYAADLASTSATADGDGAWDLVIGHSIGAAAAVVAAAEHPEWARRLVLLDPALLLDDAGRNRVLTNQRTGHASATVEQTAADNPRWHPLDIELRVRAIHAASLFALERSVQDNDPWDVTAHAAQISVPTFVVAGDPAHGAMFTGPHAQALLADHDHWSETVIVGAGHSVHRDAPEDTLQHVLEWVHAH